MVSMYRMSAHEVGCRFVSGLGHTKDHHKNDTNCLPRCIACMLYGQRTQTDSLSQTKNQSENLFVCADFCCDKKSDLSYRQFVCNKKTVCVR